ncbi:hypothetical protein DFR60_101346 [Hungatella effluvii]|uniref:BD-FAE-like domain-containing protein n=1 Tax=Hungatella effluvii TaxID=1096246 RepID=A0A2V3YEJ3_9FIRM|nr:subtype B tannase [Hungatella effluvii]PXX57039.1 hypothetical protein DFR60_101346 [Hungatella effluvii]
MNISLEFNENNYTVREVCLEGKRIEYRAFENIVYVGNPVDTEHQRLSIFVPEQYYRDAKGKAPVKKPPVFLPNTVGGYMPGLPEEPGLDRSGKPNASFYAILNGYVVVSPGARGRGLRDENGVFTGTAPACIVDQKAAVRYLKYNRDRIPGDTERIISSGTSAGGALSALLGATGNHPDYEPYLEEIGAAKETDDVYAASCYCPITNLEHADMAYEWEFGGLSDYHWGDREGVMTEAQNMLSVMEKTLFPPYLNSLKLTGDSGEWLFLREDGNGSFKDYIVEYILQSAGREMGRGTDLTALNWLVIEDGQPTGMDWAAFIRYRTRMKTAPAFDDVFLSAPENELFGSPVTARRHFTPFSLKYTKASGEIAEEGQIKRMNPMNYIQDRAAKKAKYFRIRHGAADRDTSLAISAMLTAALRGRGVAVDYQLPWGVPHAGDYDPEELFDWIKRICQIE